MAAGKDVAMPRSHCLIYANCQGEALLSLLNAVPAFTRLFAATHCINYTGQAPQDSQLGHCGLFIYQHLGQHWGEASTDRLLACLPPSCQAIRIPNLFFKGYWPFWANSKARPTTALLDGAPSPPKGPIDFADSFLDSLLARGLSAGQALGLACGRDAPRLWQALGDARSMAEDSLALEEKKQADCAISCAGILRSDWRDEQLFITVNHPSRRLLCHVADGVLGLLGLGRLPQALRRDWVHPHDDFWLPIHPALGQILNLPFAGRDRRYNVFGNTLTHAQYTAAYLACRANAVSDLLVFLRNLPPSGLPDPAR